jgi:hypothetical protein
MTEPVVKVSGDVAGGFIVELHDGDRYAVYPMMIADEAAAHEEGLRRFHEAPAQ